LIEDRQETQTKTRAGVFEALKTGYITYYQ
jgi:hypothetical protein